MSVADDKNENMISVSRIQKNDEVQNEESKFCAVANDFRQQQLYLQAEKSIEVMNKYRSIKKYDRVVSVLNDGNEHMMIVSQIQKNDRFRKV